MSAGLFFLREARARARREAVSLELGARGREKMKSADFAYYRQAWSGVLSGIPGDVGTSLSGLDLAGARFRALERYLDALNTKRHRHFPTRIRHLGAVALYYKALINLARVPCLVSRFRKFSTRVSSPLFRFRSDSSCPIPIPISPR